MQIHKITFQIHSQVFAARTRENFTGNATISLHCYVPISLLNSFVDVTNDKNSNVEVPVRFNRRGSRGARGPGPPLTLDFEAPKLSIFGPYLIFHNFFLPRFARHIISLICCFFIVQIEKFSSLASLACDFSPRSLSFTHFRILGVHLSLSSFLLQLTFLVT